MIKQLSAWSVSLLAGSAVAQPTIEHLAPENSVVVVSVDNYQRSWTRLKATPLWALWNSEQVQKLVKGPIEESHEHFNQMLEELGFEKDDWSAPRGPVGLAIFPSRPGADLPTPGFLAMADYGAKAPQMNRIVDALIKRAEEDHGLLYGEREVLGRTVYTFDLSELEMDDEDDWDDFDDDDEDFDDFDEFDDMGMAVPEPDEILERIGELHYVRDGRRFLLSSDFDVLRDALELTEEQEQSRLSARPDFQGVVRQLGDVDGYAIVLVRDLLQLMPPDPMAMMVQGMIMSILGDIRGLGAGVRLDSEDAMIEETFALYMPNGKSGLSGLMDVETPQERVPSFVAPGVVAYTRFNFQFDKVMGFLRHIAQTDPMLGPQINQMLVEVGPKLEQAFEPLGPEVHTVASIRRPLTIDSLKSLYAIESSRPQQVEAVLVEHADAMGFTPRDFLGSRIYSLDFNPMAMGMGAMGMGGEGYSIGFGPGYVLVGNTSTVEDALRAISKPGDRPGLADDPAVGRAIRALGSARSVGWGIMNVTDYVDYFKNLDTMIQEQVIGQMRQWDPEYARQMEAELAAKHDAPWHKFDPRILDRYLGPIAWELRSTEDGFVGRYLVLEPAGDD